MYKKITIIEELKKTFVITDQGKELLVDLKKSSKKYWDYFEFNENLSLKPLTTVDLKGDVKDWIELDKIHRNQIIQEETAKRNKKVRTIDKEKENQENNNNE